MPASAPTRTLAILALALALAPPAGGVEFEWATVGDPGNPADDYDDWENGGPASFGSVAYTYRISKYEVTNAQYAEFLNAVGASDPNHGDPGSVDSLYDLRMDPNYTSPGCCAGGIVRSGSPGSFSYTTAPGREDLPATYVPWGGAVRFVNWLANGQPSGAQGPGTTEDGTYAIATQVQGNAVLRNPGSTIFLPTEDEWYKAAYYDPSTTSYFDFPTASDTPTTCAAPGPTPNTANCDAAVGDPTAVGSYTGSASPYGTFDQAGNVAEYFEGPATGRFAAGSRGGFYALDERNFDAGRFLCCGRETNGAAGSWNGFRVAMVPEPGTASLLALGLVGLAVRRRRPGVA